MNDYFQFKQFIIHQDEAAMKVGTDGVLLGAWANLTTASALLDIGTGTGLLALMAAQRNPQSMIDAVEIDASAYRQACRNVAASPWNERIILHHVSVFDFYPPKKFDSILCNPPYFIASTPTPNESRTTARHCHEFSHTDLLEVSKRLLLPEGKLNLILPVTEAENLIRQADGYSAVLSRITKVKPTPQKPPKRYLLEFSFSSVNSLESDDLIIEYSRHHYSPEYQELTRDFYLNM
ncbi:tRNA1(Val) (adenine(37)-N6)-methyltransferase [Odoribacter lunatus]|uniref:tRNA1(Val) (adenine(37)-N6)-methyltransferase n=1 Tax=Odoribacter lunatus TaxID=2941335 RepID=UPI00203B72BC|nr:methyltransferase [Odoribacter lunatus]